jgi:DNA-binding transcriptional regulator GbsR (MarR family)
VPFVEDWERFISETAEEVGPRVRVRLLVEDVERLGACGAVSVKAVYLFLVLAAPLGFRSIRRSLGVSSSTLDVALKRLLLLVFVEQDSGYLYWVRRNG